VFCKEQRVADSVCKGGKVFLRERRVLLRCVECKTSSRVFLETGECSGVF
jgi:hypothetical protein